MDLENGQSKDANQILNSKVEISEKNVVVQEQEVSRIQKSLAEEKLSRDAQISKLFGEKCAKEDEISTLKEEMESIQT
eukprot:11027002-Ditylum_brightwellii.AAC.1